MKTVDDYFSDWESHVFGYGYGTGEEYVLPALKSFFMACDGYNYDYQKMTVVLGPTSFWLLLNALCHADIIEYGTSPRFGWMTFKTGRALSDFVIQTPIERLIELGNRDQDYINCYPDYCNCEEGPCSNPFWVAK